MRLIRFGQHGKERPGLMTTTGIIDLDSIFPDLPDIGPAFFEGGWIEKIRKTTPPESNRITAPVRLGPPTTHPSKIICLGKNYPEHAKEGGFNAPTAPIVFCKAPSALTGPFDPIVLPETSRKVDWEVELCVVIGKKGKRISSGSALSYVAGFSILNDVSGRDAQFADSQWFRGKSFDTFAPMGPAIVTPDEVGDCQRLNLSCRVNNVPMQEGNTRDMIFSVADIIAYISRDITLFPGDIISTGTPAGVGYYRNPQILLKSEDEVVCAIEKIGEIRNRVV